MSRQKENTGFVCLRCGLDVMPLNNGSYRNHCPACLYSRHVDVHPGDRASACRAPMKPVGLKYRPKKGWQVIHACQGCTVISVNKVATETVQEDDVAALARLQSA